MHFMWLDYYWPFYTPPEKDLVDASHFYSFQGNFDVENEVGSYISVL